MAIDLQKYILDQMAEEMSQSIDRGIVASLCIEDGWIPVTVDAWKHGSSTVINDWCNENINGKWIKDGNRWVFQNPPDATAFALAWV